MGFRIPSLAPRGLGKVHNRRRDQNQAHGVVRGDESALGDEAAGSVGQRPHEAMSAKAGKKKVSRVQIELMRSAGLILADP